MRRWVLPMLLAWFLTGMISAQGRDDGLESSYLALDRVLTQFVDDQGMVNYRALKQNSTDLIWFKARR